MIHAHLLGLSMIPEQECRLEYPTNWWGINTPNMCRYSNVFSKGEIGGNILHPEFNKPNPRSKQGSGWGGAHASHSPRASLASVRSSLTSVTSSRVPSRASKAKPKYLTGEYSSATWG
jgi:hypothetical protein